MDHSKESTQFKLSVIEQKRVYDKKDREEVGRTFLCLDDYNGKDTRNRGRTYSSWKTPPEATDITRDKYQTHGIMAPGKYQAIIPDGSKTTGEERPGAGVGPAFDNLKNSGPGQRMQASREHSPSRLDWPPRETTKDGPMRRNGNFSQF